MAQEDLSRSSLRSAETKLEEAILLNNQIPEAFHLLGYVYTKQSKFQKAILAFKKTLALDPFHTEAAIALSSLYNDVGNYKEAASVYEKARKRLERLEPGHDPRISQGLAQKHFELGKLYLQYERYNEAHHEFSKALQLEPDNVGYSVLMAKCMARSGDKPGATQLLEKMLEREPKHINARIQLGVLYYSQQKLSEAQWEWQQALSFDPENRSAQMYLSMVDSN